MEPRTVVLVEGGSDRFALEALARRRDRDLAAEGVEVVAMGGATNIGRFLAEYGPTGRNLRVTGLCDSGEVGAYRSALTRAGFGRDLDRDDMEALGFFVCVADLEDELIRAIGVPAIEVVLETEGELTAFRTLQQQPAQRDRTAEQQLRRFIGTKSGRKLRYGRLLVDALDLANVPRPLDQLLAHV